MASSKKIFAEDAREAEEFLSQNPDVETVDLLLADLNGVFRGKRVHRDALTKVFESGITLSKSLFASDITGATADDAGIGFEIGDLDLVCRPVANTLTLCPWQSRPMAQTQLVMLDDNERPAGVDPQSVLQNALGKINALGLHPAAAVELEFYLIDRTPAADGTPQSPVSPATGLRESQTQVYGITDLDDYDEFLNGVARAARIQNIPADTAVAEYAPGQFEINLHYSDDVQAACRHGILLKRLIKGVARSCGMEATFMPKPFGDRAGNGLHIHISLVDADGINVLQPAENPNDTLRHALGGLLATLNEAMLVCAPHANSYRRFSPDWYVPLNHTWGYNNRTVALRIPESDAEATRIEHRVAGADANPYLLTAAILAGMHHGITNKIEPPPVTTGNAFEDVPRSLPDFWGDALREFEKATVLRTAFGEEFHRVYLETIRQEYDRFNETVTPLEYDWYLRTS